MDEIETLVNRFNTALAKLEEKSEAAPSQDVSSLEAHIENLKKQLDAESADNHAMRVRLEDFDHQVEQFETDKAAYAEKRKSMEDLSSENADLKEKREADLKEINDLVDQLEPLLKKV